MAKIVITVEDITGSKVKIVSNPSFEQVAMMANSGEELTAAHGYALRMLRTAREVSKENKPKIDAFIPRVGK